MVYVIQVCWSQVVSKPVWHIRLLCVQWKTPDDWQRDCPKHVAVSKPVWHIPLLCVQWRTPDDGQRNCPKHVEFHSKNKFQKLVHLVGFIISGWNNFLVLVLFLKWIADVLSTLNKKTTAGSAEDIFSTYTTTRNIHVSGCKYCFSNTIPYTNAMRKYKILNPFLNTLCTKPVA